MPGAVKLIGISGPSSSGKSTIARLLRQVLSSNPKNKVILLYQDDFYKPDNEIPINKDTGLEDWDCPEAFDLPLMAKVLKTLRDTNGDSTAVQDLYESKEETNTLGPTKVSEPQLRRIQDKFAGAEGAAYVIVDGIMLYHDPDALLPYLDLAVLLRARYSELKARREARAGYVTLDGFWTDPPGYFDDMVWPGYVRHHAYLFQQDGAATSADEKGIWMESAPLTATAQTQYKIKTPGVNCTMCETLDWITDRLLEIGK